MYDTHSLPRAQPPAGAGYDRPHRHFKLAPLRDCLQAVIRRLAAARQRSRRAHEMRQARRDMYELNDHMLRDIGLHRSQIDSLFHQHRL